MLKNGWMMAIAAAAFLAIFLGNVPFPLLILTTGIIGFLGGHLSPRRFVVIQENGSKGAGQSAGEVKLHYGKPTLQRSLRVSAICLTLWFGPLIQVVQFVGFMGAYRDPGPFSPLVAGILGSIVTTWVTFVPCFLWIFLGAPYIERLRGNRDLLPWLSYFVSGEGHAGSLLGETRASQIQLTLFDPPVRPDDAANTFSLSR